MIDNLMSWFGGIFCAGIVVLLYWRQYLPAALLSALTLAFGLWTLHMLS